MEQADIALLKALATTPSPPGYEAAASRVWFSRANEFADRVWTDALGNLYALVNPEGQPRVMLAAHLDEVGLLVTSVDENRYVSFTGIGLSGPQILPSQRVALAREGETVRGAIGRKPVHLLSKRIATKL